MPDLTRFDFHAKRFLFSEDVQIMTAEEVGQYLLLMVHAWLSGKDTTLPDNAAYLARIARVNKVSDVVLAKFPIVETEFGPRRRNDTLYNEWQEAMERVESGRRNGAKAHEKKNISDPVTATGEPQAPLRPASGLPVLIPSQLNQTGSGPVRSGTNPEPESKLKQPSGIAFSDCSSSEAAAPDPVQTFPIFRAIWRRLVGKKLGNNKVVLEKYAQACKQYGAEKVEAAISEWAQGSTLKWAQSADFPFGAFLKQLPSVLNEMEDEAEALSVLDQKTNQTQPLLNTHAADWQAFADTWKRCIGDVPVAPKNFILEKHKTASIQYGNDQLVELLEKWSAQGNTAEWARGHFERAFNTFFAKLEYMAKKPDTQMQEATNIAENLPPALPVDLTQIEEEIRRQATAEEKARQERIAKFSKPADEVSGSVLDYL